ncbi:oligosaccharide flippase family protein [Capnocytophaga catalasegens]|uniref:Teichoic acid transporter n=1 Tax=Capnocytophaga catalasegens TaxID=1004260 RepID=A0AAV5AQT5_9FLAO|nr:oligosaccharide flippase family protein [Capnocytophaga catalasegens]GIZ15179.1 teichoic acid transporter [Capnocytophaga catalasegens]GJM49694.1 teichoic acid transporter [Capnocytophaga catalasegens]GJM52759.1 teichoic acid transporter [Capnocytophaga catalasegens]
MQARLGNILTIFRNNKKIIENYFFMTVLLALNSLFALLIYPYLIRTLGKEMYGLYIFATTITNYFICFIEFGFDMHGARKIAENSTDTRIKSEVMSKVFTAKLYIECISIGIFAFLLQTIDVLQSYHSIYWICFSITLVNILFPSWYFQGIQKMRIVTYIQLVFKLLSLPFIFFLVKKPEDISLFAFIMSCSTIMGAFTAFLYLLKKEKIRIYIVSIQSVWRYIKEAQYFFYANFLNILKNQSLNIIIGARFGMTDLAVYDLATKITMVPRVFLTSINAALFPKIIQDLNFSKIKTILKIERLIGVLAILFIVLFGNIGINILSAGQQMQQAYPIAIILSFTVYAFLQTGAYSSLVLIPKRMDRYILWNLIVAFFSLVVYLIIGFAITSSILLLPIALVLSAFTEIFYLQYIIKKKKLLYENIIKTT